MENPKFTNKDEIEPKSEILNFQNLLDEIYKGQNLPQDGRFLSVEQGGVFKYFEPRNLTEGDFRKREDRIFPVVRIDKEIVALSELEKDPIKENNFWIKFICVDPKYQNQGYAKKLIGDIFKFAKDNNFTLETSIYSDEGLEKIKKIIEKYEEETGVKVHSRNNF